MVAYSFQKRFVGRVQAGLEPGPWLPGMKRHTLRLPRQRGHARLDDALQLYTAMRTKHCRLIGRAIATHVISVTVLVGSEHPFSLRSEMGQASWEAPEMAAPIIHRLIRSGRPLAADEMEEFARTDGFASTAEMRAFFDAPSEAGLWRLPMTLIAWRPMESAA